MTAWTSLTVSLCARRQVPCAGACGCCRAGVGRRAAVRRCAPISCRRSWICSCRSQGSGSAQGLSVCRRSGTCRLAMAGRVPCATGTQACAASAAASIGRAPTNLVNRADVGLEASLKSQLSPRSGAVALETALERTVNYKPAIPLHQRRRSRRAAPHAPAAAARRRRASRKLSKLSGRDAQR